MSNEDVLDVNIETEIQVPNGKWALRVLDISDHRGMATKLNDQIRLDWSDILTFPYETRMHMYPGETKDVSLAVKRLRMETWQAAIVAYDDMMVDVEAPLTADDIRALLANQKLPRPKRVTLPTSNPALVKLFFAIGITTGGGSRPLDFYDEWEHLVEIARKGAIVRRKLAHVISEVD